jgi:SPP1 gp7 family putative phage head morphogenesis protein
MKQDKLVTEKRLTWAEPRKDVTFKGAALQYNASSQDKYVKALQSLVKQMTAQTIREVKRMMGSSAFDSANAVAMDANPASQARILMNQLTAKFESLFGRKAKELADRMVAAADRNSKVSLGLSLKQMSGGLTLKTDLLSKSLKTTLTATVAENVALIKSIPREFMLQVQGDVLRGLSTGQGLADIIPALEQYEGVTLRRAKNIALDQTRKAYNNINKGRMQAIGVEKFQWVHSGGGQKPRELHIEMDGNIYSFDDLPVIDEHTGERGIPGQAINCRCTMVPVIQFNTEGAENE